MSCDVRSIRPRRDWVLVRAEQRHKYVGDIFIPVETGVEKVTENAGTVLAVGPGDKAQALDLSPGTRIVYRTFLKHATPVESDETWPDGEKVECFLMAVDDIMAVVGKDVAVGVFGRPAMHALDKDAA